MKVLIQSRTNFFSMPGGDTVQILKTKKYLEELGISVDVSLELEPDLKDYDLVHLTNITRVHETYIQLNNALKQNKKIVLSTIFWPMEEFEKKGQKGIRRLLSGLLSIDNIERLKALVRLLKNRKEWNKALKSIFTIGYSNMQKKVIANVDMFLPNAYLEMQKLNEVFGTSYSNFTVIPNAIDADIAIKTLSENNISKFEQFKDAIICVGRIETRKNQLSLVKALDGSNYKLVLVGQVSDNFHSYFDEIKKYLDKNPNFTYIEKIDNDELYQLFKVCKVNALPSWLDTPGLVNLEAAIMGCNLAISSIGTTTEYFEDYACYCMPDDIKSIREAVDNAYKKDKDSYLQDKILKEYTWKKAAEKTLEAYKNILGI
ncbi:hypothetical protein BMT54_11545 [Pasteurellaceae bacterium 15-036681]|nr:hypothetical protein BMT54_11545 [Pasteurellaceae bacterium 15-036681]